MIAASQGSGVCSPEFETMEAWDQCWGVNDTGVSFVAFPAVKRTGKVRTRLDFHRIRYGPVCLHKGCTFLTSCRSAYSGMSVNLPLLSVCNTHTGAFLCLCFLALSAGYNRVLHSVPRKAV